MTIDFISHEAVDLEAPGLNTRNLAFDPAEMGMVSIPIKYIFPDDPMPVDVYLPYVVDRSNNRVEMKMVVANGESFQPNWIINLAKNGHTELYILIEDMELLIDYFGIHIKQVVEDAKVAPRDKTAALIEIASLFVTVSFQNQLGPKSLKNSVEIVNAVIGHLCADHKLLANISSVLSYNHTIYAHSINVSMLATSFGQFLNLPAGRIKTLGVSGILHDIGMAKIPFKLHCQVDGLTEIEENILKRHPLFGYEALVDIPKVSFDTLTVVKQHHENNDGSGYPSAAKADTISDLAQIIHIIDLYDRLTGGCPIKLQTKTPLEAVTELLTRHKDQVSLYYLQHFIRFLASPFFSHEQ